MNKRYIDLGGIARGMSIAQQRIRHQIIIRCLYRNREGILEFGDAWFGLTGNIKELSDIGKMDRFHTFMQYQQAQYPVIAAIVDDLATGKTSMVALEEFHLDDPDVLLTLRTD